MRLAPAATVVALVVAACAPKIGNAFGGGECTSPQTLRQAHALATDEAHITRPKAAAYAFEASGVDDDGRGAKFRFELTEARSIAVDCDVAIEAPPRAPSSSAADLDARAAIVTAWLRVTDSPDWMRDAGWRGHGKGRIAFDVNDCGRTVGEAEQGTAFCSHDAEPLAHIVAFAPDATGGTYLPTGLEVWPTYRRVAVETVGGGPFVTPESR